MRRTSFRLDNERRLERGYPYVDLDRAGIDGISGGRFRAAQTILAYSDLYKVVVSAEGNHDQGGYLADWGETYIGPMEKNNYQASSTLPLAANQKGKLFLMHSEMDDNVSPTLTLKLVDALIKANKDFDLLIIPNENHSTAFKSPYIIRRKWDYFVRHLLGTEPPAEDSWVSAPLKEVDQVFGVLQLLRPGVVVGRLPIRSDGARRSPIRCPALECAGGGVKFAKKGYLISNKILQEFLGIYEEVESI